MRSFKCSFPFLLLRVVCRTFLGLGFCHLAPFLSAQLYSKRPDCLLFLTFPLLIFVLILLHCDLQLAFRHTYTSSPLPPPPPRPSCSIYGVVSIFLWRRYKFILSGPGLLSSLYRTLSSSATFCSLDLYHHKVTLHYHPHCCWHWTTEPLIYRGRLRVPLTLFPSAHSGRNIDLIRSLNSTFLLFLFLGSWVWYWRAPFWISCISTSRLSPQV